MSDPEIERKERRKRTFRNVRIAILLGILAVVLLYAWNDVRTRRARTAWERPLEVALVLVRKGPVDESATASLKSRARDLEQVLAAEFHRHGGTDGFKPINFQIHGPIDATSSPPVVTGDGLGDALSYAFESWKYFRDVDKRADVPSRGFDSRIYLIVRPPTNEQRKFVEGQSQQGGRVGSVEVELDESMVDFTLFVATHELFHTLGATDKYDALGRARVPDGLAEPDKVPLYPQTGAEVMARNVALEPTVERPPDTLAELRVGAATAREIGWRK